MSHWQQCSLPQGCQREFRTPSQPCSSLARFGLLISLVAVMTAITLPMPNNNDGSTRCVCSSTCLCPHLEGRLDWASVETKCERGCCVTQRR